MARKRTRFVRSLLKNAGYDLVRLQRARIHGDERATFFGRPPGFEAFEATLTRPVEHLDIFLRTCARVDVFGGQHRRFAGVPKSELILRCLNSLGRSIRFARSRSIDIPISLTVVDDHSDQECVSQINGLISKMPADTRLVPLDVTGNGPSFEFTYNQARSTARDLIYFAEDDYLYDERAIYEAVLSYERLASVLDEDVVLFLADYSDRYRHIDPAYVLLGSHRHWRSIDKTTGSLIISRPLFQQHIEHFMGLSRYGLDLGVTEETTINRIYSTVPCLSPLPSLSVHMETVDTISPFVDWRAWWSDCEIHAS